MSRFPVWSPDGSWIAFQSDGGGTPGIFRQRADGGGVAERLTTAAKGEQHVPESWSPNGQHLSFGVGPTDATGSTLWVLALKDRAAAPFGAVVSTGPIGSVFSPDGKWLAYVLRRVASGDWRPRRHHHRSARAARSLLACPRLTRRDTRGPRRRRWEAGEHPHLSTQYTSRRGTLCGALAIAVAAPP